MQVVTRWITGEPKNERQNTTSGTAAELDGAAVVNDENMMDWTTQSSHGFDVRHDRSKEFEGLRAKLKEREQELSELCGTNEVLQTQYNALQTEYDNVVEYARSMESKARERTTLQHERNTLQREKATLQRQVYQEQDARRSEYSKAKRAYDKLDREYKAQFASLKNENSRLTRQLHEPQSWQRPRETTYKKNAQKQSAEKQAAIEQDKLRTKVDEQTRQIATLEQKNGELHKELSKCKHAPDLYFTDPAQFAKKVKDLKFELKQFALALAEGADKEGAENFIGTLEVGEYNSYRSAFASAIQRELVSQTNDILHGRFENKRPTANGVRIGHRSTVYDDDEDAQIEQDLVRATERLCDLFERFCKKRHVDDKVIRALPVKIRQQVFGALSMHGYNDDNELVEEIVNEFFDGLSRCLNPTATALYKEKARRLIRSCIATLYFGRLSYEPQPIIKWYDVGDALNDTYMDVTWDDDEAVDLEVSYCYFPLIIAEDSKTIFATAKVQTREKLSAQM